jgi:hypothetical protein
MLIEAAGQTFTPQETSENHAGGAKIVQEVGHG